MGDEVIEEAAPEPENEVSNDQVSVTEEPAETEPSVKESESEAIVEKQGDDELLEKLDQEEEVALTKKLSVVSATIIYESLTELDDSSKPNDEVEPEVTEEKVETTTAEPDKQELVE